MADIQAGSAGSLQKPFSSVIPFTDIEENPRYKNATYEEQLRIKNTYYSGYLSKLPEFQQVLPQDKEKIYNSIATRMPKFADDSKLKISEFNSDVAAMQEAVARGDQELANAYYNKLGSGYLSRVMMKSSETAAIALGGANVASKLIENLTGKKTVLYEGQQYVQEGELSPDEEQKLSIATKQALKTSGVANLDPVQGMLRSMGLGGGPAIKDGSEVETAAIVGQVAGVIVDLVGFVKGQAVLGAGLKVAKGAVAGAAGATQYTGMLKNLASGIDKSVLLMDTGRVQRALANVEMGGMKLGGVTAEALGSMGTTVIAATLAESARKNNPLAAFTGELAVRAGMDLAGSFAAFSIYKTVSKTIGIVKNIFKTAPVGNIKNSAEVHEAINNTVLHDDPLNSAHMAKINRSGQGPQFRRIYREQNARVGGCGIKTTEAAAQTIVGALAWGDMALNTAKNVYEVTDTTGKVVMSHPTQEGIIDGLLKNVTPAAGDIKKNFKGLSKEATLRAVDELRLPSGTWDKLTPNDPNEIDKLTLLARLAEDTGLRTASKKKSSVATSYSAVAKALVGDKSFKTTVVDDLFEQDGSQLRVWNELAPFNLKAGKKRIKAFIDNKIIPVPSQAMTGRELEFYISALQEAMPSRKDVIDRFNNILKGRLGTLEHVLSRPSMVATDAMAKKLYGGLVAELGDGRVGIFVGKKDPFTGVWSNWNTVLEATNRAELRAKMFDQLMDSGQFSFNEIADAVSSTSGINLMRTTTEQTMVDGSVVKTPMYQLRSKVTSEFEKQGALLEQAPSLEELLKLRPDVVDKLRYPAKYAPNVYAVDSNASTVKIEGMLAVGTRNDLAKLADQFVGEKDSNQLHGFIPVGIKGYTGSEAWTSKLTRKIIYKTAPTAPEKIANSMDSLLDRMAEDAATLRDLESAADGAGYRLFLSQEGKLHFVGNDEVLTFKDKDAAMAHIQSLKPVNPPEMAPVEDMPPDFVKALDNEYTVMISKMETPEKSSKSPLVKAVKNVLKRADMAFDALIGPARTYAANIAKTYGDDTYLKDLERISSTKALANSELAQYHAVFDDIFAGADRIKMEQIGHMMHLHPAERTLQKAASLKLHGFTQKDLETVEKAVAFKEAIMTKYGLRLDVGILSTPASFELKIQELKAKKKLPILAIDLAQELGIAATMPQGLKQFMGTLSSKDFIDWFQSYNASDWLVGLVNHAVKMKHFRPMVEDLGYSWITLYNKVKDKKFGPDGQSLLKHYSGMIDEAFGIKSEGAQLDADTAGVFVNNLGKALKSSEILRKFGVDEEFEVETVAAKLSEIFTLNSQAWRVWAVPRNMSQTTLLGAVVGQARAWNTTGWVIDHPEYMEELNRKGWFGESISTDIAKKGTTIGKLKSIGVRPMEVADNITRATCFRTAELLVDELMKRVKLGIKFKPEDISKELKINGFNPAEAASVLSFFQEKNVEMLKRSLGDLFQRKTMYVYQKEEQGLASRKYIGRLFGKLATYPFWTMSLYKELLSNGNGIDRLERMGNIIGSSLALTAAATAAGISYTGFLWNDVFNFSGGPYWTAMNDLLNYAGNQPENATARSRFWRNVPRMLVPGAMLQPYWNKAGEALGERNFLKFFYAVGTFPAAPD